MASLKFTANLRRHVDIPTAEVNGSTVRQVLDAYFNEHPEVRDYILDNQGAVRHHVAIFLNKTTINDRQQLSDPVSDEDEVMVVQALSGG